MRVVAVLLLLSFSFFSFLNQQFLRHHLVGVICSAYIKGPNPWLELVVGIKAVDDLEDCAATDVAGVNAFINTYLLARLRSAGILK